MKWNKKTASLLAVLSLLLGGVGAVGIQARAQQSVSTQPAQVQTQTPTAVEQQSSTEKETGTETSDTAEKDENLPGGGHQDPEGSNVDHQFEGVE